MDQDRTSKVGADYSYEEYVRDFKKLKKKYPLAVPDEPLSEAAWDKLMNKTSSNQGSAMSDVILRKNLIRLAHEHPEFRKDILPLLKEAAPASNGGFPPDTIGKESPGGSAEGDSGKGTVSDANKPWMKGEFTQQEYMELGEKQEAGQLSDGKADESAVKAASDVILRKNLIRLAHEHPEFRKDILPLLR